MTGVQTCALPILGGMTVGGVTVGMTVGMTVGGMTVGMTVGGMPLGMTVGITVGMNVGSQCILLKFRNGVALISCHFTDILSTHTHVTFCRRVQTCALAHKGPQTHT